jgi:hypothetical protein
MSARDHGWLDLSALPDLDPDSVGSPAQLAGLRRALTGAVEPELAAPAWAAMLDRAVHPPDLVEAARDGFDDAEAPAAPEPEALDEVAGWPEPDDLGEPPDLPDDPPEPGDFDDLL